MSLSSTRFHKDSGPEGSCIIICTGGTTIQKTGQTFLTGDSLKCQRSESAVGTGLINDGFSAAALSQPPHTCREHSEAQPRR